MVGAMGTRRVSSNAVPQESWSLKSLFNPQFDSPANEKKYILSYLTKFYPSSHRLLVIILVVHALISSLKIFLFDSSIPSKTIQLALLASSICLNLLSLLLINRLRNRLVSNVISFVCLCPLAILSCLYPAECHVYLLIILIYTLANLSLLTSLFMSLFITLVISVLSFQEDFRFILLLVSNLIGIYLNRLLDITRRTAYNQLCKSNVRHR